MAKLDIPFVLIDESVLQFGFRVLMSGYQPGRFVSNPVMLLMHSRAIDSPESGPLKDDVILPIGKWNNIRVDGSKLMAEPEFDDDDEIAVKVEGKVKKGYLNAASLGFTVLAVSDDEALKLPGQDLPTVTKWEVMECSIVDIPNCRNSLAIRNAAGKPILLSGSDTSKNKEVANFLNSLLPKPSKAPVNNNNAQYSARVLELLAKPFKELERTGEDLELCRLNSEAYFKAFYQSKGIVLADTGAEIEDDILEQNKKRKEEIKKRIKNDQAQAQRTDRVKELMKSSFKELYMNGGMEELQNLDFDAFCEKYKEGTGNDYPGSNKSSDKTNDVAATQSRQLASENPAVIKLMQKDWTDLWLSGESETLAKLDLNSFYAKYKEGNGYEFPNKKALEETMK